MKEKFCFLKEMTSLKYIILISLILDTLILKGGKFITLRDKLFLYNKKNF